MGDNVPKEFSDQFYKKLNSGRFGKRCLAQLSTAYCELLLRQGKQRDVAEGGVESQTVLNTLATRNWKFIVDEERTQCKSTQFPCAYYITVYGRVDTEEGEEFGIFKHLFHVNRWAISKRFVIVDFAFKIVHNSVVERLGLEKDTYFDTVNLEVIGGCHSAGPSDAFWKRVKRVVKKKPVVSKQQ